MSSNPKQLVVEFEQAREKTCKIVGTRESLLLLARDLSAVAHELPEPMVRPQLLDLVGWEQHTLHVREDGIVFQAQPDLAPYLAQRRASRSRIWPWLRPALGAILVALALIGLRTVWFWIF